MKLFGKKGQDPADGEPQQDPRSSFAQAPLPRHAGPPASSTPLADHLARGGPGVNEDYVVVPRSLAEQMPLPWQRQMASVLAQFHHTHRQLSWPLYRVLPSRAERLVDLDEEQLAEAGYVVEIDTTGELVYRERSGRKVDEPERKRVLVTCLDPVVTVRRQEPPVAPPGAGRQQPALAAEAPTASVRPPVPMNIGPQPVWDVVPAADRQEPTPPPSPAPAPPAPPPPQAPPADSTDWFTEPAEAAPAGDAEDVSFGPTGDPIERPYRFRS